MTTVGELAEYLEKKVPTRLKLDFDNVGLLAGFAGAEVGRVLVALDITAAVIQEAMAIGAELIVSHHPIIMEPLKTVVDTDPRGRRVTQLLEHRLSAICLHTNLDSVIGGVNDALAAALGAEATGVIEPTGLGPDGEICGIGRLCELKEPVPLGDFLELVRDQLRADGLRFYDADRPVKRLVVCGGAGGEALYTAAALDCDTYVTGEIKYHHWLDGKELGLNLVEAGHFCTENVVVPVIRDMIIEGFPALDVRISASHGPTARTFPRGGSIT